MRRGRRERPLVSALAGAVLALPCAPASAQGTSNLLPDPVSGRDLDRCAAQLGLSPQQRQELEPVHRQYLEEYRRLRENEVERYMLDLGGTFVALWRGKGATIGTLDPKAIERALSDRDRIMSSAKLLDDRLFVEAQALLDDDCAAGLERARLTRERARYRAGGTRMVGFVNQAARIDLREIYDRLDLPVPEAQATEPLIQQYEARLTSRVIALHEATTRVLPRVIEALEAQGQLEAVSLENGDQGARLQALRRAWTDALARPREIAQEIGDLNRATVRSIGEFLSPEHAASFRDRYLRRAYPELPGTRESGASHGFRTVLERPDLPPSLLTDIGATAQAFRARRDAILEEMVDAIDELRSAWTPMGGASQRRDAEAALDPFRRRLAELDQSTLDELVAMVGEDLAEKVRSAVAAEAASSEDDSGPETAAARRPDAFETAAIPSAGPDPFLPQPITRRGLGVYRERLDLADADWFILETAHEDYLSAFRSIRETEIEPLREALEALRNPSQPPPPVLVDEAYELRVGALDAIRRNDTSFFEDVALVVPPEKQSLVTRLARARERAVYNRGAEGVPADVAGFGPGRGPRRGDHRRSREANVDVAALVEVLDLTEEERAEADRTLVGYETGAIEGFRGLYEASLRLRRDADMLRARMAQERRAAGEQQPEQEPHSVVFRRRLEKQDRQVRQSRRSMVDLNRATLEALAGAVPGAAEMLRDAYNRLAYPAVYDDPRGAGRYLAAALLLRDLTDGQKERIGAIAAEHGQADRTLADQIARIHARMDDALDASPGDGPERPEQAAAEDRRIDIIEFDRNEASARALRQLREALTDEQEARLRLPDRDLRETSRAGS